MAVGIVTGDNVRIRTGPGTNFPQVSSVNSGTFLQVTGLTGEWYQILYAGELRYISSAYISFQPEGTTSADPEALYTGRISASNVNIRSGPDTTYPVLGQLDSGVRVSILGVKGDWYQIYYGEKHTAQAYVSAAYVTLDKQESGPAAIKAPTQQELDAIAATIPSSLSTRQYQIVLQALSLVDRVPYFWGGKSYTVGWDSNWGRLTPVTSSGSPTTGTLRRFGLDCSGYVYWVFRNAGFTDSQVKNELGLNTTGQYDASSAIQWSDAQAGDLVFKMSGGNHVGIVIENLGDGRLRVAHCSSGSNNVVVTVETQNKTFTSARRPKLLG